MISNNRLVIVSLALSLICCVAARCKKLSADGIDDIVQSRLSSVVLVIASDSSSSSVGSGVYIGGRYVVTAKHVMRGYNRGVISFHDGSQRKIAGVYDSNAQDQSIVVFDGQVSVRPAPIAVRDPREGEQVTLAGFDHGQRLRFYSGRIGVAGRWDNGKGSEVFTVSVSGDSGGPVFDSNGDWVGTLWGSDGHSTQIVNNSSSHRFFKQVAQRFPAFGAVYRSGCEFIDRPEPRISLAPVEPPTDSRSEPSCNCVQSIDKLTAAVTKLVEVGQKDSSQVAITDDMIERAVASYLARDPLTVTMVVRDGEGKIDPSGIDVAKVTPWSELPDELRDIARDSFQLVPSRE